MQLDTAKYKKEGMYLHFENGEFLDLSVENIRQLGEEYWNDPSKLTPETRANDDFKTCKVCPFRGQSVLCSAMKPLLPFLEKLESFASFARVTAVYVNKDGVVSCAETDAQKALQFVTNMALFQYCEDGKQYHKYFQGLTPFMRMGESMARVALNIFWIHQGDREEIDAVIKDMRYHITETARSCIKRLNAMCKSDAFKNAYANTQTFTEFLAIKMDTIIDNYLKEGI